MKRHLFALSALFIFCLSYAQESYTKHEFFISYGAFPVINERFDMPVNEMAGPGSIFQSVNESKRGSVNAGYLYSVTRNLAIGASYTYTTMKADLIVPNSESASGKREDTYHIVMPNIQYRWFIWNSFTFYSKAGLGVVFGTCKITGQDSFLNEDSKIEKKFFAWQASPLGIEWGNRNVAAFIEGGVGAMGCVQAGVKFKF